MSGDVRLSVCLGFWFCQSAGCRGMGLPISSNVGHSLQAPVVPLRPTGAWWLKLERLVQRFSGG